MTPQVASVSGPSSGVYTLSVLGEYLATAPNLEVELSLGGVVLRRTTSAPVAGQGQFQIATTTGGTPVATRDHLHAAAHRCPDADAFRTHRHPPGRQPRRRDTRVVDIMNDVALEPFASRSVPPADRSTSGVRAVLGRVRVLARRRLAWLRFIGGEAGQRTTIAVRDVRLVLDDRDNAELEARWYAENPDVAPLNQELAAYDAEIARDTGSRLTRGERARAHDARVQCAPRLLGGRARAEPDAGLRTPAQPTGLELPERSHRGAALPGAAPILSH